MGFRGTAERVNFEKKTPSLCLFAGDQRGEGEEKGNILHAEK